MAVRCDVCSGAVLKCRTGGASDTVPCALSSAPSLRAELNSGLVYAPVAAFSELFSSSINVSVDVAEGETDRAMEQSIDR